MKDVEDDRPVVDLVWFHQDYLNLFAAAELDLFAYFTPLGQKDEPYVWLTETSIAPGSFMSLVRRMSSGCADAHGFQQRVGLFVKLEKLVN